MTPQKKILFFVTEDWYFCSHRLSLAVAARAAGYDVTVVTRVRKHGERIRSVGLRLIPFEMVRRGRNPFVETSHILRLARIYRTVEPDIVHHVGLKPIFYGTVAARISKRPKVINAMGGLGYVFVSGDHRNKWLRKIARRVFISIAAEQRSRLILQTRHDRDQLCRLGMSPERIRVIAGAGVDIGEFKASVEPVGVPIVLMASRLLWDKGVGEFVQAANALRARGTRARFVVVGSPDPDNPGAIPIEQLEAWQQQGSIEWLGERNDMPAVFSACSLFCLPTVYGEGVPKVLLEAAASGRPIVATDLPGCLEVVRQSENGLLVPQKDPAALADAIDYLLKNPEVRRRMGAAGRAIAENEFTADRVIQETFAVYEELLAESRGDGLRDQKRN